MSLTQKYDNLFKVIIIGNTYVGKSSTLVRYTDGTYCESFLPTIGVDFKFKSIKVKDRSIKLQLWDTAGQERYKGLTSNYYKGTHGVMIIYDITDQKSFQDVLLWMDEIQKHADPRVVKILIGNKSDLNEKRQVRREMAAQLADYKQMAFLETSAKYGENIEEAFQVLCEMIKSKFSNEETSKNSLKAQQTLIIQNNIEKQENLSQKQCC